MIDTCDITMWNVDPTSRSWEISLNTIITLLKKSMGKLFPNMFIERKKKIHNISNACSIILIAYGSYLCEAHISRL